MVLLVLASALCDAQSATCTNWTYFNLPAPWGGSALGINRWGTVVGGASTGAGSRGFVRYSNGGFQAFAAPKASDTLFTRRNALGVTVGWYIDTTSVPRHHGVVVSGSSMVTVNYPGATDTVLTGINYWGSIVGYFSKDSYNTFDGFELKNGVFTRIHYPGSTQTFPVSISDKGIIIGTYSLSTTTAVLHGFVLANGAYTTFDHPKTLGLSVARTRLFDINGSGTIVGAYDIPPFPDNGLPFIYTNGIFKDITVPNSQDPIVLGINGYGYVIGKAGFSTGVGPFFEAHCQ
jgi:hypothetical protein